MRTAIIPGYEGRYTVTESGEVFSGTKKLRPNLSTPGYHSVCLCINGKPRRHQIHRLVANAFIPNPKALPQVNHKNGVKTDNRVENLEWCTCSENHLHALRVLGKKVPPSALGKFGAEHNRSKAFVLISPDGEEIDFGSGLEATRRYGFDHTSISYARKHQDLPHTFRRGKLKGWTLVK